MADIHDATISSTAGSFELRLIAQSNPNSETNSSTVSWTVRIRRISGSAFNFDPVTSYTVNIDSFTYSGVFSYNLSSSNTELVLAGLTTPAIAHNADGSKSILIRARLSGPGPLLSADTGNQTMVFQDFVRPPLAPASITVAVSGRNATVTSGVADTTNRPAIIRYEVQRSEPNSSTFSQPVQTMDGSRQFTYSGLEGGKTYLFRVRGVNSEGNSPFTTSGGILIPAGGKRWTGSAWVPTETAKRWTGSAWVDISTAKRWNGSAWVDLS
jgi:hypothetical protein